MRYFSTAFTYFGGVILAAGLLWIAISGGMPGRNALADALPDEVVNLEGGILLALIGAAIALLGKTAERFAPGRSVAVDGTAAPGSEHLSSFVKTARDPGGSGPERPSRPGPQRRVCLKPAWPQRRTQSWIGGLPDLPATAVWPVKNGAPLPFLAQIALSDMPLTLWQGLGPRSGWLVFFGDTESCDNTVVLHVDGPVEPHPQPPGVTHHWHWNTEHDALRRMFGDAANVPPRWFLELADPATLGAIEDMEDADTKNPHYWDDETGDWIWAPTWPSGRSRFMNAISLRPEFRHGVDWPGLLAILGVVRSKMEDRARSVDHSVRTYSKRHAASHTQEVADRLAKMHESNLKAAEILSRQSKALDRLEARLLAIFDQEEFSPRYGEELHAFARALDDELQAAGCGGLGAHIQPGIERVMENYARNSYAEDPDLVPAGLYALFSPLWAKQCAETAIFLGSNAETCGEGDWDARLIDMPSNPLTGLSIGDESRFHVDIRARAFENRDLSAAQASNTHGAL